MTTRLAAINFYLMLSLLLPGCKTTEEGTKGKKKEKEATVMYFHLEVNADGTERNSGVPVYRENPMLVNVHKTFFLSEADMVDASVVETVGGFAIRVQFDRHGTLVLDNTTTAYKGQRIAVYARFNEVRWLAAPVIKNRIQTGEFIFTPDATREESEKIVRGLKNIIKELQK